MRNANLCAGKRGKYGKLLDHVYTDYRCSKANPDVPDPQMQLLFSLRWRMRDTQALVVRLAEDLHSLRRDLLPRVKKRGGGGGGGGGRGASAEYEKELHQLQDRIEYSSYAVYNLVHIPYTVGSNACSVLVPVATVVCVCVCRARRTGWSTSRRVCCAGSATCRRWTRHVTCGSSAWSSNNNAWRTSCSSSCSSKKPSSQTRKDDLPDLFGVVVPYHDYIIL